MELTETDVASALQEVDAVFTYLEDYGKESLEGDNFQFNNDTDGLNFDLLTLENLAKVKGRYNYKILRCLDKLSFVTFQN